jgi:hypothetical protein
MDEPGSPPRQSPLWRIGFFLRDLLPENNLQWLFPLASLLLLVGWDYRRVASNPRSSPRILYAALILGVALRIAYTASFVLWSVRVRNPLRKFFWWVLLLVILESLCAPLILTSAFIVHVSALESPSLPDRSGPFGAAAFNCPCGSADSALRRRMRQGHLPIFRCSSPD